MAMNAENEKIFEHYQDFIPKIRMMVVDEMQPDDRCRFTRCSKSSNEEAKNSLKYIYGVEMISSSDDRVIFNVSYDGNEDFQERPGYTLKFREKRGNKYIKCSTTQNIELWREPLDNSVDVLQLAVEYFKTFMKSYHNTIKYLEFSGDSFKNELANCDYEIDSLNNLEELILEDEMDDSHYLSKLQQPLKNLCIDGKGIDLSKSEFEQVYQVQKYLHIEKAKITYEQMLRFIAPTVIIPIGNLTEKDIHKFIRSWQNGTIGKDVRYYVWYLNNSNFDVNKLFKLLRQRNYEGQSNFDFEIRHYKEAERSAIIEYGNDFSHYLTFEVEP